MFDRLQPSPGQNTCLLLMVVKLVSVLPSHWDRTCEKMPRGIKMIVIAISHKCWLVETLIPESCVNKHKRFLETGRVNDHERTDEANFHHDFNGVQGPREQPNQCPKQKIVSSILRDLIFRKITEEEHHYRDSPLYLSSSRSSNAFQNACDHACNNACNRFHRGIIWSPSCPNPRAAILEPQEPSDHGLHPRHSKCRQARQL